MRINVLSINDKENLDKVYITLNSVKQTKQDDTVINYYLILQNSQQTKHYFDDLISQDFNIIATDAGKFLDKIHLPKAVYYAPPNKWTMIRCLTPSYYSSIQKMLYLDTDTVFVQDGIEELWQTDIEDYFCAGCQDVVVTNLSSLYVEQSNTYNHNHYINAGVILFNYKRIRQQKLDKVLTGMCRKWTRKRIQPYYLDQTLINYIFRDKIKLLDYKYNDFSLVTSTVVLEEHKAYLNKKYGYNTVFDSIRDAVIVHFLGTAKPWKKLDSKVEQKYPYFEAAKQLWETIIKEFGKNET